MNTLIPVDIKFLYAGLRLPDDIYNFDGRLVLLKRGDVLTPMRIEQLMKFNSESRSISVYQSTYNMLMEKAQENFESEQEKIEWQSGYKDTGEKMESMMETVRHTKKVDKKSADTIGHQIGNMLDKNNLTTVLKCIDAPRPMDEDLQRHCSNVSILNGLMGKWLGMKKEDIDDLILAGVVHDVGKTRVADDILNAPRKLTDEEFAEIKKHPGYADEMLNESGNFSERVINAARHHHESAGGGGYPDGLVGDQISLFAKITAISDVYDAMISKRSYKDARSPLEILGDIAANKFSQLDGELTKLFVRNMQGQFLGKTCDMSDGSSGLIAYIPPNDVGYPVIDINGVFRQTDDNWKCIRIDI